MYCHRAPAPFSRFRSSFPCPFSDVDVDRGSFLHFFSSYWTSRRGLFWQILPSRTPPPPWILVPFPPLLRGRNPCARVPFPYIPFPANVAEEDFLELQKCILSLISGTPGDFPTKPSFLTFPLHLFANWGRVPLDPFLSYHDPHPVFFFFLARLPYLSSL